MDSAPPPGGTTLLRLRGSDALAVLHRISTNALLDLEPEQARATLFCDHRGRLVHRAIVGRDPEDTIWLLRPDAPGAELAAHLDRHVFRDDVRIEDLSDDAFVLLGPAVKRIDWPGMFASMGSMLMARLPHGEQIAGSWLVDPMTGSERIEAPEQARNEAGRIRIGLPRHGHEIRDEFNPFEVGLHHEVHLAKGCYTGQEVLMRLITYGSVRRGLTRFEGAGEPPDVPADVTLAGEPVGRLTSSVADGSGGWLGLAVLRPEACAEPGSLEIAGRRDVRVAEPFPVGRPLGLP